MAILGPKTGISTSQFTQTIPALLGQKSLTLWLNSFP